MKTVISLFTIALSGFSVFAQETSTPDTLVRKLQEFEVKAKRKTFKIEAGKITADVASTPLSELPTTLNVLNALPDVRATEKAITVEGRGTPIIYYGHQSITLEELLRLNPKDIKSIEVIRIPDASYPNGTAAVIKIKPKVQLSQRIGAYLRGDLTKQKDFGHYIVAQGYWDSPKLSLKVGTNLGKSINYEEQPSRIKTTDESPATRSEMTGDMTNFHKNTTVWTDAVYRPNERHELGAKYELTRVGDAGGDAHVSATNIYSSGREVRYNSVLDSKLSRPLYIHSLGAYYHATLSKQWELHAEGTYYQKAEDSYWDTRINYTMPTVSTDWTRSNTSKDGDLWAWRSYAQHKAGRATWLLGFDGSYTSVKQTYQQLNTAYHSLLPATENYNTHSNLGLFASWSDSWGKHFTSQVGLRLERQSMTEGEGAGKKSQSKLYLFPSLTIGYQKDKLSASLSYEHSITNPSFGAMRTSINYIDELTMETGNPSLRPKHISRITLSAAYSSWQLNLVHMQARDATIVTMSRYALDTQRLLINRENINCSVYGFDLSYSPTIGVWRPSWRAGLFVNDLNYLGRSMNKPMGFFNWSNLISLKGGWTIQGRLYTFLGGHDENTLKGSYYHIDLSVTKRFSPRFSVSLSANDLTASGQEESTIYTPVAEIYKLSNSDYPDLRLSLVYNFNRHADKYRGGQAGSAEQGRF